MPLSGGLACYNIYGTADGRHLSVGALESKFWERFCQVIGRQDFIPRQFEQGEAQDTMTARDPGYPEDPHTVGMDRSISPDRRLRRAGSEPGRGFSHTTGPPPGDDRRSRSTLRGAKPSSSTSPSSFPPRRQRFALRRRASANTRARSSPRTATRGPEIEELVRSGVIGVS